MANFSERLKQLRTKKGVSQQELADVIGVNKMTISGYERGVRRPAGEGAKELYEKLADYFNVDISYLMGISDISVKLDNPLSSPPDITKKELGIIEKYRALDERGKQAVLDTLNREYSYIRK